VYGPGNVLFYTSPMESALGQIKPGSTTPDKVTGINQTSVGVDFGIRGLNFVPSGFVGAGQLKIITDPAGLGRTAEFYTLPSVPDGSGTFNFQTATLGANFGFRPDGR